ncbi:hypothetical protein V8F20_011300 [Naviculisporaceae sp. PSN 640]
MESQPTSPGPSQVTLDPSTPSLPEKPPQSRRLPTLSSIVGWCTKSNQVEAAALPNNQDNTLNHTDYGDAGWAENIDPADMFQETDADDDFVLINSNGNPITEATSTKPRSMSAPAEASAEPPKIAPDVPKIIIQEAPGPKPSRSLRSAPRANELPPVSPKSSTVTAFDSQTVREAAPIIFKTLSWQSKATKRCFIPKIPPHMHGRSLQPPPLPASPILVSVKNPCKCKKPYREDVASWMASQMKRPLIARYQTQCRRESKLGSACSMEFIDLQEDHHYDQPCCDLHIDQVLENCLCDDSFLKQRQRRAYEIRVCLQGQVVTGPRCQITHKSVMHYAAVPLVIPGAKRPLTDDPVSAGSKNPSPLKRARQRVLAEKLQQYLDLEPTAQNEEKVVPTPCNVSETCSATAPSEQNEPNVQKAAAREFPVSEPWMVFAKPANSIQPHETDITKSFDHPITGVPAGIRDMSYCHEMSVKAAGRAWAGLVVGQDTTGTEHAVRGPRCGAASPDRRREDRNPGELLDNGNRDGRSTRDPLTHLRGLLLNGEYPPRYLGMISSTL